MRTIFVAALSVGIAVFTGAANASAQAPPSATLNALEVRQLVARGEPADHARLSAHFSALAGRYAAEARRHIPMGQTFAGGPARSGTGASAADHCKRLARLNTESAATLRELAAHHEALVAGASSPTPLGAARFHEGEGAPEPTDADLDAIAAKASTPADHRALEEYFVTLARRYTAETREHSAMANTYRGTRIAQAALHCDRLVKLSRDSAKEATAAAALHSALAGTGE